MRPQLGRPGSAALAVVVAGAALVLLGARPGDDRAPGPSDDGPRRRPAGRPDRRHHRRRPSPSTGRPSAPRCGPPTRARTSSSASGRAGDVEAYLAGVARREVTGVGGDQARLAAAGSDTSLPDPAGVDVWALSSTGRGTASLTWPQEPGRWRLVAAVDGATPPAEVVLSWQRGGGSSSTPVLVAVGCAGAGAGSGRRPGDRRGGVAPPPGPGWETSQEPAPPDGPSQGPRLATVTPGPRRRPGRTRTVTRRVTQRRMPLTVGRRRLRPDVRDRPDGGEDVNDTDDRASAPAPFRQERRP